MATDPPNTLPPTRPGNGSASSGQQEFDLGYSRGFVAGLREMRNTSPMSHKSGKCCDPCDQAFGRFLLGLVSGVLAGLFLGLFMGLFLALVLKS